MGCKPISTPIVATHKLVLSATPLLEDSTLYRRLVGQLIYLTVMRLDLAYLVHILSQFMAKPTKEHLQAANRVSRYAKGSSGLRPLFS